ncbi:MAG: 4-hydroxythreonine-4-phosphate dehydrogenase PdxA [Sphingomonadales bacterium]|jgi:4-hydroxythreonine-4-phosphate dehydrogenase|nr:4-hydroxythreonine-4-phosphate dehydrogenase PdxA [Sphingomonadales bacterium]MBK9003856.1 4-hydroxythreonine-4-phosphate dehydrogenase PdxA [Sphingomonadales bacterium]MBK9269033.1 4-hydroxythreonine-4-phosphate dehydrogenase PdxA [Sphingomonadales bacterium]MBP6435382.1 4-hydroxythreonine-4-phosphate dehydrogenase PdxA [Sphingorhabdus sp.]
MAAVDTNLPLAISSGDPAGVGPEIIGKAWEARKKQKLNSFFAIGDIASFARHWDGPVVRIDNPDQAAERFDDALPVFHVHDCTSIIPGTPDLDGAHCALQALELATGFARSGTVAGLVTGPVSKAQLYAIGFNYPGQTEFVAERCGVERRNAVMMLAGPDLRVVPMTTHIPLSSVASQLDVRLIRRRIRATAKGLSRDFGIKNPRLAIAGFNPHAGESGNLGREEIDIFGPALTSIAEEGYDVVGPLPADTMFHAEARKNFDAALCAYHDQALIPLKTLYFHEAVNITLGLPVVRTSPDHGTAFVIAGKSEARPDSMIAAIRMAGEAVTNRKAFATAACPA